MKARHYIISGRVQGVGFRWYTRRKASLLGVRGWVRNKFDGSVEVWAEAPEETLEQFEHWLESGPPGAWVSHMVSNEVPVRGENERFEIR